MPEQVNALFAPRAETQVTPPQASQPPAPQVSQDTQQPGAVDIAALATQLQQQMQAANAERVNAVSAVFDAFPAFASLKAECLSDFTCSAEKAVNDCCRRWRRVPRPVPGREQHTFTQATAIWWVIPSVQQ